MYVLEVHHHGDANEHHVVEEEPAYLVDGERGGDEDDGDLPHHVVP